MNGQGAIVGSYTTSKDDGILAYYDTQDNGVFTVQDALAPRNGGGTFGVAIATTSTMMIVGAPSYSLGTNNIGSAFLYQATGAMGRYHPVANQTLSPASTKNIGFGNAVAISNNLVLVGASGCTFLYYLADLFYYLRFVSFFLNLTFFLFFSLLFNIIDDVL